MTTRRNAGPGEGEGGSRDLGWGGGGDVIGGSMFVKLDDVV